MANFRARVRGEAAPRSFSSQVWTGNVDAAPMETFVRAVQDELLHENGTGDAESIDGAWIVMSIPFIQF